MEEGPPFASMKAGGRGSAAEDARVRANKIVTGILQPLDQSCVYCWLVEPGGNCCSQTILLGEEKPTQVCESCFSSLFFFQFFLPLGDKAA